MSTRRSAGLTLTDVLAVMFLVVVATAITISAQANLTDREEKILCQKNLAQWGKGMMLYSNENKGSFPRTVYENSGKVTAFTQPAKDAGDPNVDPYNNKVKPAPNDITAAVFRMAVTQMMQPEVFVCPATDDEVDGGSFPLRSRMNFSSPYHLSYSFVNVYPTADAIGKGFKTFITAFNSDFAIASDLNPGGEGLVKLKPISPMSEMQKFNSPNHRGSGQNVLYADGHVEFQQTPFAGAPKQQGGPRDNVFTYGETTDQGSGAGVSGSPVDATDSVLLPTAAERPAKRPPTSRPARAAAVTAINEAVKAAMAQPLDPRSVQTLFGRKYVTGNGDYLQFTGSPGEVDVRIGQQTYAGRYSPGTAARLRLVLTVKGDTLVQYLQATLSDGSGRVDELTDEKGNVYRATAPPAGPPTTMPFR